MPTTLPASLLLALAATTPADVLIEQPLANFGETCDATDERRVHRMRFATVTLGGGEDRLELRTTTTAGRQVVAFIVSGDTIATAENGVVTPTPEGQAWIAEDEDRAVKDLAAFAAAIPRGFAEGLTAPQNQCDELAGKAEQLAKCGLIGLLGNYTPPFVRLASALAAGLCTYLVAKVCEENPDSCEDHPPGWTEG